MVVYNNVLAGAAGSGGAAGYTIERSLRFNSADSAYLSKNFSSAGNRQQWTFSAWIKFADVTGNSGIFECPYPGSGGTISDTFEVWYTGGDLHITDYSTYYFISAAKLRDPSAWGHLVIRVDTTLAAQADRIRLYWNGEQLVNTATSYPTQNANLAVNNNVNHQIGNWRGSTYSNLYYADIHHVDGQSLDPTSFGEFDEDTGVWSPIKYSGSYGTNGFHLDFSDNSSNAALGYDAAGSNNWTVNNLDHTEYTPFQKIDALGTVTSAGGYTLSNVVNAFDANTDFLGTTWSSSGAGNADTITWTPGSNITVPSGYNLYFAIYYKTTNNNNRFFRFTDANGTDGTEVAVSSSNMSATTNYWTDVTSALPTAEANGDRIFSAFRYRDTVAYSGQYPRWYSVVIATSPPDSYNAPSNVTYLIDNSLGDPVNSGCDSLLDSPTNYEADSGNNGGNYATLNPLNAGSSLTLSNGNLDVDASGSSLYNNSFATIAASSGLWYFEVTVVTNTGANASTGVATPLSPGNNSVWGDSTSWGIIVDNNNYYSFTNGSFTTISQSGLTRTGTFGFAFDASTGKFWATDQSGTWLSSGDPAAGTNPIHSGITTSDGLMPFVGHQSGGSQTTSQSVNFGQRPFAYTPPTGFKSLCTQNLDDPLIADGSDYFDVKTWSGTGAENTLTGFKFSPDMIWVKRRDNGTDWHNITDTVRGATNTIYPNDTYVETVASQNVKAFTSDGVTLGTFGGVNASGGTYVGWTWDAGANSSKTYTVKVVSDSGNKYRFDDHGTSAVTLDLEEGSTYVFDQSDSSNSGHPLRFSTTSDGTHGSGSEYTTGVTTTGTPGSAGAKTTIVVAASAPTLYYYCSVHSGMGGQVNTNSTAGATVLSGSLNSSVYNQDERWSDNAYAVPSSATAGLTNLPLAFNGYLDNNNLSSFTGEVVFPEIQFASGVTEVIVYCYYSGSTDWWVKLNQNGTQYNLYQQTIVHAVGQVPGGGAYIAAVKLNLNETSITRFSFHGAGNHWFAGVSVNGKLLVNDNRTPPNVPSVNSVVRADQTAGFSIVSYTGNGTAGTTIGHGLNATPEFVLFKSRSASGNWLTYHKSLGDDNYLWLDTTGAQVNVANTFGVSSSTLTVQTYSNYNTNSTTYIAYCFAPVEGYSAFGEYAGNSSTDGPFVHTGFRPAFLILKRYDTTGDWIMLDSTRDTFNTAEKYLYPSSTSAESTSNVVDFLSNGFKLRYAGGLANQTGNEYIYMAFAENPFKTARAR